MKSKIISELKKSGLEFPQSRGEVSVQEQLSTLRQAIAASNEKLTPVERLRVINASIMPTIVHGHTNAPTIMIAEKGADLITRHV